MSSLLNQRLAQHHLSRVRPIPLRDLPLSSDDFRQIFPTFYINTVEKNICEDMSYTKRDEKSSELYGACSGVLFVLGLILRLEM